MIPKSMLLNESYLYLGMSNGTITRCDLNSYQIDTYLHHHTNEVNSMIIIDQHMYSSSRDGKLVQWNIITNQMINSYGGEYIIEKKGSLKIKIPFNTIYDMIYFNDRFYTWSKNLDNENEINRWDMFSNSTDKSYIIPDDIINISSSKDEIYIVTIKSILSLNNDLSNLEHRYDLSSDITSSSTYEESLYFAKEDGSVIKIDI